MDANVCHQRLSAGYNLQISIGPEGADEVHRRGWLGLVGVW